MKNSVLKDGKSVDEGRYYTIKEAAPFWQRYERTIGLWTVEGKIHYHKHGPGCKI